jgi:CSLREA domain-containing protein
MKRSTRIFSSLLTAILLVVSLLGAMPVSTVHAAPLTYTVNQTGDAGDGTCDATCTLRDAITAANGNFNIGTETDTIVFSVDATISLSAALPNINGNLVINAAGHTVKIDGNNARRGLYIVAGIVTVNNLTIQNGFSSGFGGGVANTGTLTLTNSTIVGSHAQFGGGIANLGTLTIANSTFYGNGASYGGGAYNEGGTLTILNSTFSGNSATPGTGGGVYNQSLSTLNLGNTILANSTLGGDCANNGGTIGSNTSNLIMDNSCLPLLSGDPKLVALADNGGYTQTMALLSTSPARNAGSATICTTAPVSGLDQRGMPRDTPCDIGAYEAVGSSELDIYPNPLIFGEQAIGTTSDPKEVTVSYLGEGAINLGPLAITGEFAFVDYYNNCNYAHLTQGTSCTFEVTFSPLTVGAKTGTVTIPDSTSVTLGILNLKGTGTDPIVGLSATTIAFPRTYVDTASRSTPITITNIGTGTLIVEEIFTQDDFVVHTDQCTGTKLQAAKTCTFKVTFTPLSPGVHIGMVGVKSNASTSPDDKIDLRGVTEAGTQLLKMGNFDVVTTPIPWVVSAYPENLVRIRDCSVFRSPFCAARFTGARTNPILSALQVVWHTGSSGDRFLISLSSRASRVPLGGQYQLMVSFYGPSGLIGTKTFLFSSGTHAYQTKSMIYTAPAAYNKILFNFTYQKTGGIAWFDDAMLILLP